MKFRRYGYNEAMPAYIAAAPSPKGQYVMGSGIRVITPDGMGETADEVWSTTTSVDVYLAASDEIKSYPVNQISRYKKGD